MRTTRNLTLRQLGASLLYAAKRSLRLTPSLSLLVLASLNPSLVNAETQLDLAKPLNITLIKANQPTQTLSLPAGTRLSDAIDRLHISDNDYWPAIAWLRQGISQQYRQKHAKLISLIDQQIEQDRDNEQQWAQLKHQVLNLLVNDRMVTPVHPDRIYAKASENFLLQDGDRLILPARPKTITITGFVERQQLPYQPQSDVRDYLAQVSRFQLADNSEVWLIHPDTRAELLPIAYWNKQNPQYLAPGSIIFVPAKQQLFSEQYQQINQLYLELLQNQYIGYRQGE